MDHWSSSRTWQTRSTVTAWQVGADVDVLSSEPPALDIPLLHAKNCIVTPHIAWATKEARTRPLETLVTNLRAFIEGHPGNVVNQVDTSRIEALNKS
jgi:phosphoglycerate dehydrogenase-like enzyme